jgi:hypothetical protein
MWFLASIPEQTRQSEQEHCHGQETNCQCTFSQDVSAAHIHIDVAEHPCKKDDSQFIHVGQTLDAQFCLCQKIMH